MSILVTGSEGMIGVHLVRGLLKEGYMVVGIDKNTESSYLTDENYHYFQEDIGNKKKLEEIIENNNVDRIIHLAALAHTANKKDFSWRHYYYVNVKCARNVFEASGERPVLFISTVDVYGFYDGKELVNKNTALHPVSKYGRSKKLAEDECRKLMHYSIYRFSPVYTDTIKRDIQKRYYLKYPNFAYKIGKGGEFEILNIKNAVKAMTEWCRQEPKNDVRILKDPEPMYAADYIKAEKAEGRAKHVIWIPRWTANCGYVVLKKVFGKNEKTYLLNKAVHPLKSE